MPTHRPAPGRTVTIGQYLATRLWQLNCHHLFGVPGDFSLGLLDEMLTVPDVTWVGCANELNAAYAADGYARTRRSVGAVITTYGVGELSAINAIAGSYAEDVPVVQITGLPSTAALIGQQLLHHSLVDGDHWHFLRAYREVTAAGVVLRSGTAAAQIDRVLLTALDESKPVYLAIPSDEASAQIPADALATALRHPASDPAAIRRFREALPPVLARQASLTVLAGAQLQRRGLEEVLAATAALPGVSVATQISAKAALDEAHSSSLGTYLGAMTTSPGVRAAVDLAPLLVLAGTTLSDVLTGLFTHEFSSEDAVELSFDSARIATTTFPGLRMEDSTRILAEAIEARDFPCAARASPLSTVTAPSPGPLTQTRLWGQVQRCLPEGMRIIADIGTALYGVLELQLPSGSDLLCQPVWSSIGYTLPATLGACEADPGRRSILFIGDGAAQVTIQELGTILQRGHTPIIMLINNGGYTIERTITSPDAVYQDIPTWDWTALTAALAPGIAVRSATVRTSDELAAALEHALGSRNETVFIEAVLHRDDAPALLSALAGRAARTLSPRPPS